MSEEATIKIRRKKQGFVGWGGGTLYIVVGEKVQKIENGKEELFKLAPGNHTIIVKGRPYKSKRLSVSLSPGDVKCLECGYLRPSWDLLNQLPTIPLLLWCALVARPFTQFPSLAWLTPKPSWVQPALMLYVVWLLFGAMVLWQLPGIAIYLIDSKE